ncbi:MAG: hypothetical protein D6715_06640, partial [Calditrichaeota bacterium]
MAKAVDSSENQQANNGAAGGEHACQVTLEAVPRKLPERESVYVTGNLPALGDWDPGAVRMQPDEAGNWRLRFSVREGTLVEFKFTRGNWDTEAVGQEGIAIGNTSLKVNFDTRLQVTIPDWKDLAPREHDPIQGTVVYHRHLTGEGLPPRDVVVWLPPGYQDNPQRRYPVLYAHDGQNLFDPATSYTGVDWRLDETAYALIEANKLEPIIIVGIYNTPLRLQEYSLSPLGEKYRKFLVTRLKPFIDQTYRTRPEARYTATMGSSMGGLVSFLLTWRNPHVFGKAICMSPSFIYRKGRAIRWVQRQRRLPSNIQIYLDCGARGSEKLLLRGCKRMLRFLKRMGMVEGQDLFFYLDEDGVHNEESWGRRVWRPLLTFFGRPGALEREMALREKHTEEA